MSREQVLTVVGEARWTLERNRKAHCEGIKTPQQRNDRIESPEVAQVFSEAPSGGGRLPLPTLPESLSSVELPQLSLT